MRRGTSTKRKSPPLRAAEPPEFVCALCEKSWTEVWPRDMMAIRCSHEGSGRCRGFVTEVYPAGHRALTEEHPAPVWCGARKEREHENL